MLRRFRSSLPHRGGLDDRPPGSQRTFFARALTTFSRCNELADVDTHAGQSSTNAAWVQGSWTRLVAIAQRLADLLDGDHAIPPAGQGLIDNLHVAEEHVRAVVADLEEAQHDKLLREALLPGVTREAPPRAVGMRPRIHAVLARYAAEREYQIEIEALRQFLVTYQTAEPLDLAELWAIPHFLRVTLLTVLDTVVAETTRELDAEASADQLADVLLAKDKFDVHAEAALGVALDSVAHRSAFVVQLVHRLRHRAGGAPAGLEVIGRAVARADQTIEQLIEAEQARGAALERLARNIFGSLRAIGARDWRVTIESLSRIDALLRDHTNFGTLDFPTRDRLRHAIEDLARRSGASELAVTQALLTATAAPGDDASDPAHWLIGPGRAALEARLGYGPSPPQQLLRAVSRHVGVLYFGPVAIMIVAMVGSLTIATIEAGAPVSVAIVLALLAAFPASEIAFAALNRLMVEAYPPRHLRRCRGRSNRWRPRPDPSRPRSSSSPRRSPFRDSLLGSRRPN